MAITLHELDCFLAAARTLGFSRGAQELRMSVSSLSEQIAKLERATNRRLFDRGARGVTLTPAGHELLPLALRARESVSAIDEWSAGVRRTQITVGLAGSAPVFSAILAAAADELPHVGFAVSPVGFTGAVAAVSGREVDCALAFELESSPVPDGLRSIRLWTEDLMAAVPASHPLAARDEVGTADLYGEVLVAASAEGPGASGAAGWYGRMDPELLQRCDARPLASGADQAIDLVAVGIGINITGASAVQSYARAGVAFVPLRTSNRISAQLLVRDEALPTPLTRFLALAKAVAAERTAASQQ